MRLVIGYSDKGPFNNPVYIDNKQDFISLFGNISKRLEKKGVFFHRMALQALSAGPILALNLKPFGSTGESTGEDPTEESINYVSFNTHSAGENTLNKADGLSNINVRLMSVRNLFDTNRFWKLDADQLAEKVKKEIGETNTGYINIAATDTKAMSCSFFMRKCNAVATKQYDITIRDWYRNFGE